MSKLYTSKKAGYSVLSGNIKSIAEDRTNFVVSYREYDPQLKKATMKEQNVTTMKALGPEYKEKDNITVLGGIMGQTMQAVQFSKDSAIFEVPQMSVVSGMLEKVRLNEEKNEDGTPKTRRSDGAAKKPHLDIFVTVQEEDKPVHHIVKVYNSTKYHNQGDPTNIEKYMSRFEDKVLSDGTKLKGFENAEDTPIRVTICTQPGREFAMEREDGVMYYGCDHLGINSIDLDYQYKRTLNKDASKDEKQEADTPSKEPKEANTPEPVTPEPLAIDENEGIVVNGFDEDMSLDFT